MILQIKNYFKKWQHRKLARVLREDSEENEKIGAGIWFLTATDQQLRQKIVYSKVYFYF